MRYVMIVIGVLTVLLIAMFTLVTSTSRPDLLAYRALNEMTAVGTVEEVREFYCPVSRERGTHVLLKTAQGTMLVHVGVERFLRDQKLTIHPGERLQVRGAKIRYHGKPGMIAREIIRGGEVFTLRDDSGKPQWSN